MISADILLAILLGAIAGSFLSTFAIRRRLRGSADPRSHCDQCGITVPVPANVPIVSFVLLHGRCGACGGAIDVAHPIMEVACAAIGGIALSIAHGREGWILAAVGWALALLALIDARELKLPDVIVLPLGAAGLSLGLVGTPPAFETRAIGMLAGFTSLWLVMVAYRAIRGRDGLGRGDAKLLGTIGAWVGWQALPAIVLEASTLGIFWVVLNVVRGRTVMINDRLPFGTLLSIAAWTTIAVTHLHIS